MKIELALAAVHLGTALKYRRGWSKDNVGVEIIKSFNKDKGGKASQRYRLYLPIHAKRPRIKVPHVVQRAVDQAGYVISDYIAGLATQKDGKRVMKIGKLLKNEHARNTFANDPQRQSHKNEYTCVISCHPYDIIGMSTGRTWDQFSCMRLGAGSKLNPDSNNGDDGAYADTISHDIKQGTLVAYAVKNSDMDIKNPDARLLIKPYMSDRHDVLFRVETKIYGNHVTGFRETISAFLRKVNASAAEGRYSLMKGLYNDGAGNSAYHMGSIAYADLSDPAKLEEWTMYAGIGDYSEKFKENNEADVLGILKTATSMYSAHIFNDVVADVFPVEDLTKDEAEERLQIMLERLIAMGKEGKDQLNVLMDKYLRHWTQESLSKTILDMLAPIVKYNPEKNYPHSFLAWAWKLNPAVLVQPNGDVNQDFDRFVKAYRDYPLMDAHILNAKYGSTVRSAALAASYVNYANAVMKGATTEWKAVDPSRVPDDGFVRGDLQGKINDAGWSDDQKLFAMSANSADWFNKDNANNMNLPYLEKLTVANLFNLPFIKQLYEHGLDNTPNDIDIGEAFGDVIHRICMSDPEGVKREETRMYELAELLGEHDYGTKRYIEKDIERVLYD